MINSFVVTSCPLGGRYRTTMHRSRIGVVLIDHPADTYDGAAAFWAAATGAEGRNPDGPPQDDPYESLPKLAGANLELQRIGTGTPARVHLDIETDDVAAEVARLVALGATVREERSEGYVIMDDPGGLVFCVVPVQTTDFADHAAVWP